MKELTMAIVGYGGMGSYHAHALIPDAAHIHLKGAFDIDPARQQAIADDGFVSYPSYGALLADPEIDLVLVATPNDRHKPLAIQALNAGKHVISEKPAMMSPAELEEVLAVAKDAHREFFTHQNRRWDPDFRVITEIVESHSIGDVFRIESRVHGADGIPGDWRHYAKYGGGMIRDWGVHLLDQLLFLLDGPISRVTAETSTILGNDCDDGFTVRLDFASGIRCVVEVGTTNFISLPRWYVKGTKGTAEIIDWDLAGEQVIATGVDTTAPAPIRAGVGLTKTMAPPTENAVRHAALPAGTPLAESFYDNVHDVITAGAARIVKNEEVLRLLRLIDAIFQATETGQSVGFE
ncbi:Gfo/Idh/MocA family protein [Lacticaseibacillus mingshuiensis]|uniref:Gfo/Idh/MocA family protein n=1 Tax=Lacticaseibacillus mingshuiensis TaxID=2799574 RepID=UPI0019504C2A|nr:Gfo/Idh/MocA family oxidoreductase [Lacticaseibacillus mingshuiensis]